MVWCRCQGWEADMLSLQVQYKAMRGSGLSRFGAVWFVTLMVIASRRCYRSCLGARMTQISLKWTSTLKQIPTFEIPPLPN